MLLAGTVAEEMIYNDVSTGAQNDLERATEIARSMVMDYGMSPLGRITYRENRRSPFLMGADDFARDRSHSEQTAREIDEEIRKIVNQSLEKVRHVLETRRRALVAMAERLIEKEVIDTAELKELVESNSPSPMIVPGTGETPKTPPARRNAAAGDQGQSVKTRLRHSIIVGDRDPVRRLYVAPLERIRPDWPIKIIDGAGHLNCIFKPQFKEELKKWVDKETGIGN